MCLADCDNGLGFALLYSMACLMVSDPRKHKIEQAKQRKKDERSLLSLQNGLLLCNVSVEATTSTPVVPFVVDLGREGIGNDMNVDKNVMLKAANVVSPKVLSEIGNGNRVSVLEAFSPAIEMLKSGELCYDDERLEGKTY
ncbi:hypothetical protein RJT34_17082 [Clitoria ternatea]|uniref:Uncharacterized protein n=1 Tax=Clitoria ternatea TaxID=43366 RepID=A0AAN9J9X2_CLITE